MESRNPATSAVRDALLCGVILGAVLMGMISWLIGAALVGAMGHGDWIISAWDALRWMLIVWMLGCGQGFYGGWWYHYRMPPTRKRAKKTEATRSAATEASGRDKKTPSLYARTRSLSRRDLGVEQMRACATEAPYDPPGTMEQYRALLCEVNGLIGEVEGDARLAEDCRRFLNHLYRRKIGLEHTIGQKQRAMEYQREGREDEGLDDQAARGQGDDAEGHGDFVRCGVRAASKP